MWLADELISEGYIREHPDMAMFYPWADDDRQIFDPWADVPEHLPRTTDSGTDAVLKTCGAWTLTR
jgi:hypothetical protein